MTVGATDAHHYEQICDTCLRCSPSMAEPQEAATGVHGTNERIPVRAYLQGIRVLIDLMEHVNLSCKCAKARMCIRDRTSEIERVKKLPGS